MDWSEKFEGTRRLSPDLRDLLVRNSQILTFEKNATLFSPHKPNKLLFLIEGQVRVQQVNPAGREIVLFRAIAGENCVMTTAGLLSDEDSSAEGIAETRVEAAAISREIFDELMSKSAEFRKFVLKAYNKRILDLFQVVNEVAFGRIDIRLASRLLKLAGTNLRIQATHQDLANELGTAREVISRQLNEFQRRGFISQARGQIEIANKHGLISLSQSE